VRQGPFEAVVFDLGGVLIDWDPRYLYRSIFDGDEAAMERFLAEVTTPAWNAEQDAGRTWREAIDALIALHPDRRDLIVAYDERWAEMLGGAIEGTVAVLADLRAAGTRLAALSNWSAEKFPIARARYRFLDWFETIVVSGEVGIAKPDPRIFRHLLELTGLVAEATVYVDDVPANVAVAEDLGMVGLRFRDPGTLRDDLRRLGLAITDDERDQASKSSGDLPPDRGGGHEDEQHDHRGQDRQVELEGG
jgi:2-haloacid dehalogenase